MSCCYLFESPERTARGPGTAITLNSLNLAAEFNPKKELYRFGPVRAHSKRSGLQRSVFVDCIVVLLYLAASQKCRAGQDFTSAQVASLFVYLLHTDFHFDGKVQCIHSYEFLVGLKFSQRTCHRVK